MNFHLRVKACNDMSESEPIKRQASIEKSSSKLDEESRLYKRSPSSVRWDNK